jgi:hypothetical protein
MTTDRVDFRPFSFAHPSHLNKKNAFVPKEFFANNLDPGDDDVSLELYCFLFLDSLIKMSNRMFGCLCLFSDENYFILR